MKKLFAIIAALVVSTLAFAQEDMNLNLGEGTVYGTLLVPEGVVKPPVVILHAGSGPTDRNGNNPQMTNNSLKFIAEELQTAGIASLRYDKRLIAASHAGFDPNTILLDDYVNDLKAFAEMLKKDGRFSDIIIVGHSEGSLIGMLAAIDNPNVSKYISISGSGRPGDVIIKEQIEKQIPAEMMSVIERMLNTLKRGETIENVTPGFEPLFGKHIQPYMISWLKHDPSEEIAKLKIPILIIQGNTDIQVRVLDANILASENEKATKVIIDGMNHVLKSCASMDQNEQLKLYTDPEAKLHPDLMPAIIKFVR